MHAAKCSGMGAVVAALALAMTAIACGAESREALFLAGLRERELFDLAERHCTDRLLDPELTEIDRSDLTVELLRTLAAHAMSRPRRERDEMWRKARAAASDFARKWPRHPRLALVTLQDALTPLARGEQALREHETGILRAEEHAPSHAALREAGELLGRLDKELTLAIPQRRRTPPQADELTAEELELLHQRVRGGLARASLCRGLLFPAGSDDRLAMLAQARERLEHSLADPKTETRLAQAMRLELAECWRLTGRYDEAVSILDEFEQAADSDSLSLVHAGRIHVAIARDNPRDVLRLLESDPVGADRPELDFARLAGRLIVAKAARDPHKQYDEAARELRRLDESGSTYWALRAGKLLAQQLADVAAVHNAALLARRADSLILGNQLADAIAAYDAAAAAAQAAGDERAAFSLGYKAALVELDRGQIPSAVKRLRAISQDYAQVSEAAAAHLLAARHAGDLARTGSSSTDECLEILQEHLATWPDASTVSQARLWLGRLAESRGQLQAALDAYAGIPTGSSHFAAALQRLSELAQEHPDSGPIQAAYAGLLLQSEDRKQIAAARDKWQEIFRRSPPGSERRLRAAYSIGLSHFKLGDKAAAAGVLRAALAATAGGQKTEWEERIKSLLQQCTQ